MKLFQELEKELRAEALGLKQRLYLEEIAKEWSAICFQYRIKLHKPCFCLTEGSKTLGSWCPETKTMSLSLEAVESLSWDSVVSLLKHEMAHQIVSEIYLVADSHGQKFQMACDRLGILGTFRRANLTLDYLYETQSRTRSLPSPLSRKLEKLDALSRSDNQNEAQLALQRLQELKHALAAQGFESESKENFMKRVVSLGKKKVDKVHSLAAQILVTYFGVEVIYASEYHVRRLERTKTIVIMGRAPLVEMAEYVFHFACNEVERLWQKHKQQTGASNQESSSFKIGVMVGFESTLKRQEKEFAAQEKKLHGNTNALIEQKSAAQRELGEFVNSQFPRLAKQYSKHKIEHTHAHQAGREAGRKIALRKPFQGPSSQRFICEQGKADSHPV